MHMFRIWLGQYIEDLKEAVKEGAEEVIERATSQSVKTQMRVSLKSLRTAGDIYTLAPSSTSAFRDVVLLTCGASFGSLGQGLPPGEANAPKLTYMDLATTVIRMSRAERPLRLGAPFFKKGTSQHVLRCAMSVITDQYRAEIPEVNDTATKLMARMMKGLPIKVIPWSATTTSHGFASWNYWARLITPVVEPTETNIMEPTTFAEELEAAITLGIETMKAADPSTPWKISTMSLKDLPSIMKKGSLPEMEHPFPRTKQEKREQSYVYRTYEWVWEHYNPNEPSHFCALLISILLARLTPHISFDKDIAAELYNPKMTYLQARQSSERQDWMKHDNLTRNEIDRVGSGFIALAIGLVESHSDLRKYTDSHSNALGTEWTTKHSE